jgi:arsenate reductase (thioredoxin)
MALELLQSVGLPTDGLRSNLWDEVGVPGAPALDFVITVCDTAAGQLCPVWPGHPLTAHWGVAYPAAVEGTEQQRSHAFRDAFHARQRRIQLFVSLPIATLERLAIHEQVRAIGTA